MSKSINELFVELEAAYIKKAKYVKIINTMKHSNITYRDSMRMDHPIYSLKQAEYEVKRWENVYHNKIVKHINTYITNKKDARISLHSLSHRGLIDLVVNNLKKVQQARRHLQYVQHIYKDYKTRLEDINTKIIDIKQEIVNTIIYKNWKSLDVTKKVKNRTIGEIEDLAEPMSTIHKVIENEVPQQAYNNAAGLDIIGEPNAADPFRGSL